MCGCVAFDTLSLAEQGPVAAQLRQSVQEGLQAPHLQAGVGADGDPI